MWAYFHRILAVFSQKILLKKNNTFFWGPKMKIGHIQTVLYVENQLFYATDFFYLTSKKSVVFFWQFPDFCHNFVQSPEKPKFLDFKRSSRSLVFFSDKQTSQGSKKTTFSCLPKEIQGMSNWSLSFFL